MQIEIYDYSLENSWALVTLFSKNFIYFTFTQYDAVTAAIDLGFIEQPDDRDKNRIGYEHSAFSATVREVLAWENRIQYQDNTSVLRELSGTEFAEQIVRHLALQVPDVREVIQAEDRNKIVEKLL